MGKIRNTLIVVGGGKPNFALYHITQVINGNNCELQIVDITNEQTDNYYIGENISQNTQQLYIVIHITIYSYPHNYT